MIIHICSSPRSGNSFFSTTLPAFYGGLSKDGKEMSMVLDHTLFSDSIYRFYNTDVPQMNVLQTPGLNDDESKAAFVKQHDLPTELPEGKVIGIVRDGRDCLVSYAHFTVMNTVRTGGIMSYEQGLKLLIERNAIWHWNNHVMALHKAENVSAIVRYEGMVVSPLKEVSTALLKCGIEAVQTRTAATFEDMKKNVDFDFFRKGIVGCYKTELPESVICSFNEIAKEGLQTFGYEI